MENVLLPPFNMHEAMRLYRGPLVSGHTELNIKHKHCVCRLMTRAHRIVPPRPAGWVRGVGLRAVPSGGGGGATCQDLLHPILWENRILILYCKYYNISDNIL